MSGWVNGRTVNGLRVQRKTKLHLFNMWGASTQIALCGRKLKEPFTVPSALRKFGMNGYCDGCKAAALKKSLTEYSAIEDRAVSK